ncbi:hypothetical protein BD289DRAFT_48885 [Coniella lustricola]|uniref:Secreted protein n=1 Tax=Coniella lustricola TaxID=2025994 RepID=A0A2T3AIL2_9PEZI|nr:hypothetical protein BD289DRAFT_48885 [Coniella lustricola]
MSTHTSFFPFFFFLPFCQRTAPSNAPSMATCGLLMTWHLFCKNVSCSRILLKNLASSFFLSTTCKPQAALFMKAR